MCNLNDQHVDIVKIQVIFEIQMNMLCYIVDCVMVGTFFVMLNTYHFLKGFDGNVANNYGYGCGLCIS